MIIITMNSDIPVAATKKVTPAETAAAVGVVEAVEHPNHRSQDAM